MLKSQKSTKKVDPVEKDSDVIGEKVKSEQLFEEDGEASKVFLQVAGRQKYLRCNFVKVMFFPYFKVKHNYILKKYT